MKKIITFLLLFAFTHIAKATVLQPGDVAIVQVNYTFNSLDFVCYVDIDAGTEIWFSDYAYSNNLTNFDQTTTHDGIYKFTAAQAITAGTVIQYRNPSNVNSQFTAIAGSSSLSLRSYKDGYLYGENLIIYQSDGTTKTFLFAMGWMRKDNFSTNPTNSNAKVCDIPPGLSKDNYTVIQIDSVMKPGQNPQLARDFRYNKYEGFTGTASKIRYWLSNTSNYDTFSGSSNNDAVENFTALAPDVIAPSLLYSYPSNNKLNTSSQGIGVLKFNEPVIVSKSLILKNSSTNQIIKTYNTADVQVVNDSIVNFLLYPNLENSASYSLTIPKDYVKDYDGNSWPADALEFAFATNANKSIIECCFPDYSGIIVNPYFSDCAHKDDLQWTTLSRDTTVYGDNYCNGYFSWTMSGLPMKYYMNEFVINNHSTPDFPNNGLWSTNNGARLVVNLTGISHNITDVISHVYDNNSAFFQRSYSGANLVSEKIFSGYTGDQTGYLHYENENASKIDSIVFGGFEGRIISFKLEIIDKFPPTVELGNARIVCDGDSIQLDAGLTLGAVYDWSTGAKTQKTWAKTSGNYSVTVKNTLGQASDNVQVTVKPVITLSMPDTIFACVGDTVTLIAGTNTENSYFWSPDGQTTPSIKVTQSGIYHALVNNGAGGCFSTDSTRVIYKGAKAHIYNLQGGSYGSGDVKGQLYRKNSVDKFEPYREMDMLDFVQFDSLPAGDYIFKMHFVNYSFVGENPWMDTYHDGSTKWTQVTPLHFTCQTDTMIDFLIASKSTFEFNGTAVISGKVQILTNPNSCPLLKVKADSNVDCDTRVVLFNSTGDIIATTCPDSNGNYSFTNLPSGNYSVGIERTGFELQSVFTTSLTAGQTVSNADFTLNERDQTVIQGITSDIKNVSNATNIKLSLVPNPAVGFTNLEFEMPNDGEATISISDLTGRVLRKENVLFQAGKNRFPLAVNQASGIYFVKIATGAGCYTARLIVR